MPLCDNNCYGLYPAEMAKDVFHQQVRTALEKDGWVITHDPFTIRISEAIKIQIDLAAENVIAAQRESERVAIEIKSFISESDISSFHTALGQYLNYVQAVESYEPERVVYLAIPVETHEDFFQLPFIQESLNRYSVNVVVYDPDREEIVSWKK